MRKDVVYSFFANSPFGRLLYESKEPVMFLINLTVEKTWKNRRVLCLECPSVAWQIQPGKKVFLYCNIFYANALLV